MSPDVAIQPQADAAQEAAEEAAQEATEAKALADRVAEAFKQIEASETLDPEQKEELLECLRTAQKWLETSEEQDTKAAQYKAEAEEAPLKLEQIKRELEQSTPDPVPEIPPGATLAQLEQGLGEAEEASKTALADLAKQEERSDLKVRADRKAEIGDRKEAVKEQLQEAEDELKGMAAEEDTPGNGIHRLELEARCGALKSQLALLDSERIRLEAVSELLPITRDLAQGNAARSETLVEAWREVVTEYRKAESERQAAEARRIATEAHPAVRDLAMRNAELAEGRTKLAQEMELVSGYLESVGDTLSKITDDFKNVKTKVEVAGMTPTVGLLLRNRRDRLPDVSIHHDRIEFSGLEMQRVQMALLELENERSEMGNLDEKIEVVTAELASAQNAFEPGYLETMVRQLMQDRRDYLDGSLSDFHSYHDDLNELDLATRDLLKEAASYSQFIDENVLWIRSAPPLAWSDVNESFQATRSLFAPSAWWGVGTSTLRNAVRYPAASGLLALCCLGLVVTRRRIRLRLEDLCDSASQETESTLASTLLALLFTVGRAAVWPLILWCVAWWMLLSADLPLLAAGLATALKAIAVIFFMAELFRQVSRPGGLAERHFGWHVEWTRVLHRSINRLLVLGLPMAFLVKFLDAYDQGVWKDSLGRLAFISGLLVLTAFLHDVLNPRRGGLKGILARIPSQWPARLHPLWYLLGVGFPLALVVLAASGYSYSADQLLLRFRQMLCLVLVLVLGQAVLLRAVRVSWARLARMRANREALRLRMHRATLAIENPEAADPTAADSSREDDEEAADTEADIQRVGTQLAQLVRAAAVITFALSTWFIWDDMFPALQVLNRIELWSTTQMVEEAIASADATSVAIQSVQKLVPVTLADLLLVVVVVIASVVASRSLPGLLEVSVLRRLPMDRGARHAVLIITRYLITLFGAIIACRMLGMTWASVQWLAAAMTVGLGFGLQEIFANLVSGLIILFERPIRLGDRVTVGGVTGKVTRMQIRATTITDNDRRELIVPNKRFITDDVVNWTLSDPISRFILPIGIAYESDPALGERLLLQAAKENPLVLDEPEPQAVFRSFGDSTLNLELRAFLATRDHYIPAVHQLNLAIGEAFREAGIEIAFPQQDVNIRGLTELFGPGKNASDENAAEPNAVPEIDTLPRKAA